MTIADRINDGKALVGRIPMHFLVIVILLLSATASFGLGVLAERDLARGAKGQGNNDDLWIEQLPATEQLSAATVVTKHPPAATTGSYVASKTGTKYYTPDCAGAKRIKDSNKVWFATKADAEATGRTTANCPGI